MENMCSVGRCWMGFLTRPMSLNDARELICHVVRQWLDTESQRILNSGTSNGS